MAVTTFWLQTPKAKSKKRQVGLEATDPHIIAELIKRFDSAPDLEKQ